MAKASPRHPHKILNADTFFADSEAEKSLNLPLANRSALRLYPWQCSCGTLPSQRCCGTIVVAIAAAAGVLNELFIIFVTARKNSCWLCLSVAFVFIDIVVAASAHSRYCFFLCLLLLSLIYYISLLFVVVVLPFLLASAGLASALFS